MIPRDAIGQFHRACCRIEPDRKARSATPFIALYLAAVVVLGAVLATLAGSTLA